jgi:hypothetical protein
MASLDDILSTQKNGVIAINNLANNFTNYYTLRRGAIVAPTAATTSISILYTVPSNIQFQLQEIDICNTSGTGTTFSIYLVPSGGSATTSNALFYSAPIGGLTTVQWQGGLALPAGSTIRASASITSVTFKIAGGAV